MIPPAPRLEALSSQKRPLPSRQKCFTIVQKMIRTSLKNVALCCKNVDPGHSSKQNHPCRQTSSFLYNFILLNLCKEYADTGYSILRCSTHKYTEYRNNDQYLWFTIHSFSENWHISMSDLSLMINGSTRHAGSGSYWLFTSAHLSHRQVSHCGIATTNDWQAPP